jgi:uncharacterized protein (TIGR03437 family)
MRHLSLSPKRWAAFACLTALVTLSGFLAFSPRPQAQSRVEHAAHDERPQLGKDWDHAKLAREAFEWHAARQKRLIAEGRAAQLERAEAATSVTNDTFLIQDDGTLVTGQNFFDLNGRAVLFTPAGAGYSVSAPGAAFDSNFGAKLDLTAAPAANPKIAGNPDVEPGDDAYLAQALGFNFNYFGTAYSTVYVTSNGNLVFRPASAGSGFDLDAVNAGDSLSDFRTGSPRVAPYWHDLDARAVSAQGASGVYFRRDADRVVVTYNNVRDFPNTPSVDNGFHTFQATLFSDGRILFVYQNVTLTSHALVGVSPGGAAQAVTLADLSNPAPGVITAPIAEYFSREAKVDEVGAIQAFYAAHPGRDEWENVYFFTDFDFELGGGAFAYYAPVRNEVAGIGGGTYDLPASQTFGSSRIRGWLNMGDVIGQYPEYPTTRMLGANSALSILGQEQGHRWLAFVKYPGASQNILLGRDTDHWSFFFNSESTLSHPAARRSSSAEGNVWRENGNGTFTSVNLIDGYSRLDQYLMGLRPASDVPATFVIGNPSGTSFTASSGPRPNVTVSGARLNVTVDEIIQRNGARTPDAASAPKKFRTAFILLSRQGTQPAPATLNKLARFRLAWESYFAHSTDYLGTLSTAVNDADATRVIAAVSAASYTHVLTPGGIASLFGQGLTAGGTQSAATQPLPLQLAGTQVLVNGTPAPLYYASPTQINFEVPVTATATTASPSVQSATATLEVISQGQLVRACAIQLAPSLPAVFAVNQQGTGSAAALDAVTLTPAPFAATQANSQPNIIALFASGLGADATDVDGNVAGSVQVTFNGQAATVQYAGRAPGFAGLNQINFHLPAGVGAGTYQVVVSRNGFASNAATVIIR